MAVSDLSAARCRTWPGPARLPLICLYLVVGVTGVCLGSWPLKLATLVLVATAAGRIALSRQRAGAWAGRTGAAVVGDGVRS
jgi:hypothetical protein